MTHVRAIVVWCLLVAAAAVRVECNARLARAAGEPDNEGDLGKIAEVVADESRSLDDELLGSIVKDFGDHMKETMQSEMNKLIDEVEETNKPNQKAHKSSSDDSPASADELDRLREANKLATEEIGASIALAADTKGALPQWSPGQAAGSLLSAASNRLQVAGSFVSDRMRSLGGYVKKRVPLRLRRLARWPSFLNFKIKFNKSYKSMREELYRQMLYLKSSIVNGVQHVRFFFRRDKHLNGATQFSDWTELEYHDHFNNEMAEVDADLVSGPPPEERPHEPAAPNLQLGKRVRAKRSADDDDSDDELNETEDEELENELEKGQGEDDDDADDDENLKIIEEYANGADLENLDEMDGILDEAIKVNNGFKPIDLRDTNCIIKSQNQDTCGACYSYVVNTAAYYYNCMDSEDKRARRYHARFTSDCGKYLTPPGEHVKLNGCNGGMVTAAFNFTRDVGVQEFGDYEIARISNDFESDNCAYPRPAPDLSAHNWDVVPVPRFRETRTVNIKFDQIDVHLRTMGPVFVNIRTWPGFKEYFNGIYDGKEIDKKNPILHSMLLVGHNQDRRGRDYYTIWNSHGIAWGDTGFLHIYADKLRYFAVYLAGLMPINSA